jgi:purine nucleosidase
MSMMLLLQSPQARVLGITVVSGDAWEPEEVQHTLRMLELLHRTDVPVVPGAVFPLLHTRAQAMHDIAAYGCLPWYGAWGDLADHTGPKPYHGPFVLPPMPEGQPTTKPLNEDAAHFLIQQVHAHPHAVTIFAAGPLTNIALAISIDPDFAALTQGIVIMGGSLNPQTDDADFTLNPRHEFNFWFDPEAAHIVLRAPWPRIDLTDVDVSVKTRFTPQMSRDIGRSAALAAQYVTTYTKDFYYMWDELAAAAWLDPSIVTRQRTLYVDVDAHSGPSYGNTLVWTADDKPTLPGPEGPLPPIHVQDDIDLHKFNEFFVHLMQATPANP